MAGRALVFGEVLFDCFPDGSEVLGGAPFNVAWHLHGFGEAPLFVSRIGADANGDRVRAAMADWGMDTAGLQVDAGHPTGRVRISFDDGEPCYDIVADQAYDHVSAAALPEPDEVAFVYHGSLAVRAPATSAALDALLGRVRAPVFLDVNLRPPWWRAEDVLARMARATWLKLNDAEMDQLFGQTGDRIGKARTLLDRYGLEQVVLTLGAAGAIAVDAGGEPVSVHPEAAIRVVDTVGAGDAFASVLMLGLLRGWPRPQALRRAQQFASSVVGRRGATVAEPDFYRRHLDGWEREDAA